ncbi:MAG: TusE/DsrC/DsvC family sulfur relay protein [Thiotrichales bacterium]|jgi:tRNA 2-thiouridine synthesizing protein E|nr:TusE/DsrC/DsvC family sulfur relay protein [Thiotrichales bacterium]MBT3613871.1 TusE/DsrC/DsvC family sulfur relay protein [Thiotrichales bacterium]MBT3752947.1 TusE/DsrC/DsvC family sulfur relay protein [Thiotrichales bacterium]MBT3838165.1 TusE/DsrC/DsvC family sulfur relay protein [Thiotrichales bacterium]MBT4151803.1 TusE/DsrC/DsvC family sulfur relay protein [Thiotrichales bacterium]
MNTNPSAIRVEYIEVDGKQIATDQEGYIQDLEQWSPGFAEGQAKKEGLAELTSEHWDVINLIRSHYEERGIQIEVRKMIKHFAEVWGKEHGNNRYLHDLFPMGGPQKQGNRIAGIRKTKGEH